MANINYKIKLHSIKALALDVDGVLTDGGILALPDGDLLRTFNSKDGFAMRTCKINKFPIGIITGGSSPSVTKRFLALGIEKENIFDHARNKVPAFMTFCERNNLKPEEVAYIGDDIPDIGILKICGLAVSPSDAVAEVKEVCDYVSMYPGGKGCVRDFIEQILKVQGLWDFNPELHSQCF